MSRAKSADGIWIGQAWKDYDSRTRRSKNPRILRVVDDRPDALGRVILENMRTGRKTAVRVDRLRPTARGYIQREDM